VKKSLQVLVAPPHGESQSVSWYTKCIWLYSEPFQSVTEDIEGVNVAQFIVLFWIILIF